MTHIWRKAIIALALAAAGIGVTSPSVPVHATGPLVYIFNTTIESNRGLEFCATGTTKGCIDSVIVDGQALSVTTNRIAANFIIAGGLYSPQCRFVETEPLPCEIPYLVLYPVTNGMPTQSPIGEVTVNFRRAQNDNLTTRIGTTVVNGNLKSFTPAKPGLRDIATVVASPVTIQRASSPSSSWCAGWVTAIDMCTVPDNASSEVSNTVNILLLPGMRSSIVPPDKLDSTCVISIVNQCIIPVFEEQSFGGWMDTDAYLFGMTAADRDTGATQMKIAGPHFKYSAIGATDLNFAYVRSFVPSGMLMASFGLTPAEANATTLPVTRTTGFTVTRPTTTYTPTADGLMLNSTGIGFSTPTVSIQRVLVVKANRMVTTSQILKAAGVYKSLRFGAPKITTNIKAGMKKVGTRYTFSKVRSLEISVRYKSTAADFSFRTLRVKVMK
jgi:hypothetical protein